MQRAIVGYHLDAEGHHVADLACGHGQHLRHNPPWENRAWVLNEKARQARIGAFLNCVKCDRGEDED